LGLLFVHTHAAETLAVALSLPWHSVSWCSRGPLQELDCCWSASRLRHSSGTVTVQALGAAAQHYSAFCSKDKGKTGLSLACSSAQSDKNLNLRDECFSGHCNTGQYEHACTSKITSSSTNAACYVMWLCFTQGADYLMLLA